MNELLKHVGLIYYYTTHVVSVPEEVNRVKGTSFAYHKNCKVGMGTKMKRVYAPSQDILIDFIWLCDMSYLGLK